MSALRRLRPEGLVSSPAFSHVAVVPPGATTIYLGGQNSVYAQLRSDEPPLIAAARVSGLGVPGALVEISAVAAVLH